MTPDLERFGEALAIRRLMGEHGPRWIAQRIGELAIEGDQAGIERFQEIATAYEQLLTSTIQ